MKELVGIIGGAGVVAANKLLELIEEKVTQNGAYRDCHHPEMIVWQATQAPSRSMYLEGKGESFVDDYVKIGKHLKSCGVTKLCMCCNTAHYAIDLLSSKIGVDFINLIEEVAKEVKVNDYKKVGVMASDGCIKGNVYDKYFKKICPEVEIIYPEQEYQEIVTLGICNAKNNIRYDESDKNPVRCFSKVEEHLLSKGAEKVILGCTDIRPVYKSVNSIDSLEILAKSILNCYKDYNFVF